MATRAKSPKDTIKIRRLPAKGATIKLEAEVVRVAPAEGSNPDLVTVRIPGYSIPITLNARYLAGDDG